MSANVRLVALLLCFAAIAYKIYGIVEQSLTESLDADSIRGLYATSDALVKNPKGTKDFLTKRLGDNYIHKGILIRAVKDKPDEVTPVTLTKAQFIQAAEQASATTVIDKYEHKIVDIKYSDDDEKKYAYVSSTETSSGTMNFTLPDNKKLAIKFNEGSGCIDTLTIIKRIAVMVQSNCTEKVAFIQ